MTAADKLFERKDALLAKIPDNSDPAIVNYLEQIAAIFNVALPAQTISISSAENSAAFMLPSRLNFAHIGTTGTTRTLKLQYTPDDGSSWHDTGIEVTTSSSVPTHLSADDLAQIVPLCGREEFFRLNLDGDDTITTIWYSSN
jgi:hypothetical protein